MFPASMVVNNLNIFGAVLAPTKTNSPLIVNANAMLAFAIAFKRFKPVRRRCQQVPSLCCIVQHLQFAFRDDTEISESPDTFAVLKRLCVTAFELANHTENI
jgi:hypothetical protein